MKIQTTRFGEIETEKDTVITFPEGLPGFEDCREYIILKDPSGGPLHCLQSVSRPEVAFVICDPIVFRPDYRIQVTREDLVSIRLDAVEGGIACVIIHVPENPLEMTANLQGPVVINVEKRLGKQFVLRDAHPIKCRVLPAGPEAKETV
ncbi:MAG: flagellar assembly protein FliW [Planctomycetota bacterium]